LKDVRPLGRTPGSMFVLAIVGMVEVRSEQRREPQGNRENGLTTTDKLALLISQSHRNEEQIVKSESKTTYIYHCSFYSNNNKFTSTTKEHQASAIITYLKTCCLLTTFRMNECGRVEVSVDGEQVEQNRIESWHVWQARSKTLVPTRIRQRLPIPISVPPPSSFRKRSAGRRQQKRPSRARTWRPRNPRQSSRSWGCWSRTGGGRRRRKAKKWLPGAIRGHTRRIEMERHVGELTSSIRLLLYSPVWRYTSS